MDTNERLGPLNFGLKAYGEMQHNRSYALTNESRNVLGVLAKAMFERRIAEGRSQYDAVPTQHAEFFDIIQRLNDAGCNLLQERPGDEKPLPSAWLNPLTQQPLPPPKTPDERAVLGKTN